MKTFFFILVVFVKLLMCDCEPDNSSILTKLSEITLSEDGKLNFTQLVNKYGHTVEQYDVTTEDGYILTMFHIPGRKSPVLLAHGLTSNGDNWVIRGPGSLGTALADAGYDVWVMNNRGTGFSRRHVRYNPDTDKEFWDYSFHDMGIYDMAAAIDFVRNQTGQDKIFAIGHSQGAIQPFPLMSLRPEYNERVKLLIALAPGTYFNNMPPLFRLVADVGPIFTALLGDLGIEELFRDRGALSSLVRTLCSKGIVSYAACVDAAVFPFVGFNPAGFEIDFLPTLFGHYPSGFSRKCLVHYDQLYLRKKFSQFDYGAIENLSKYGSIYPPEYDLKKVTVDVALMAGALDKLVLVENVKPLQKNLANAVHYEEIAATTHFDFVFGLEASKYLFPSVFKLLHKYESDNDR